MFITIITVESNVTLIDPAQSAQVRAYVLGIPLEPWILHEI